jgi:hypothetical protein
VGKAKTAVASIHFELAMMERMSLQAQMSTESLNFGGRERGTGEGRGII